MLILLAIFAAAEPASEDSVFEILGEEEQVVTTSRAPLKVRESGSSVWVIDRQMIEATAASSLGDILRMIPGVIVRELSPSMTDTHFRFPLLVPDNQVLVTIDGRNALTDVFGYTDKNAIELSEIERIEVIMGPSSTLYGTNAFAGVINVITKRPEMNGIGRELKLRAGAGWGSDGTRDAKADVGLPLGAGYAALSYGAADKFGMRLSLGGDYIPSFSVVPSDQGNTVSSNRRISGTADFQEVANGWQFRQRATAYVKGGTWPVFALAPIEFQDYALTTNVVKQGLAREDDELSIMVWARHHRVAYTAFPSGFAQFSLSAQVSSGEIFAQYRTPKFFNNQIVVGTQIRGYLINQAGIPSNASLTGFFGLFAEDTWRPIEKLVINVGVRVETNENAALKPFQRLAISPRAAIVFLPSPNHGLRLEYATAFRNPTPIESFIQANNIDGVPIMYGDPNLRLENVQQLSLGYNGKVDWFRPRVDVGISRVTNFIIPQTLSTESDATSIGSIPISYDYVSGTTRYPVVFTNFAEAPFLPSASVKLEGDWQWLKVWVTYALNPIAPRQQAALGGQLIRDRFVVSSQLYFIDEYKDIQNESRVLGQARLIWNASFGYTPDPAKRWTISVAGTNLLDARMTLTRGSTPLPHDYQNAERIAQRIWLQLSYRLD